MKTYRVPDTLQKYKKSSGRLAIRSHTSVQALLSQEHAPDVDHVDMLVSGIA